MSSTSHSPLENLPGLNRRGWLSRLLMLALTAALLLSCHGDDDDDGNNSEPGAIRLERVLSGFSFAQPLLFLQHPADDNIFYVVQKNGVIWRSDPAAGTRDEFVDLDDYYNLSGCNECGLLGMAFHPDFAANGFVYLSFTEGPDNDMTSYVARFRSADDGLTLATDGMNPSTLERTPVFEVAQPFTNHNGGHIAFDTDGLLYLGLGDGGSANDPQQNGQDVSTPLGKMLRMNADGSAAAGNAVAGGDPRIYALGLRNPWRWSFDRQTGELWLGDVGQGAFEEVNIIVNGGNYGWRCREGFEATPGVGSCALTGGTSIDPVAVYNHSAGISITGGYVYRGQELGDDYQGVYFFGDYGSGVIWGLFSEGNDYEGIELLNSDYKISSFGEDRDGELYVIDYSGGGVYRVHLNDD